MPEEEKNIIDNIANKLQIILDKDGGNILKLSKLIGVDKQPLYRIMKREHIPNIIFLLMIAKYLNCTIAELIDEAFFLDIDICYNYDLNAQNKHEKYRIYVRDENFMSVVNNEFFGVVESSFIKVFYKTNKILNDGYYLVHDDKNRVEEINILSAGTNLIIALINNQEVRLTPDKIKVTAKLYKTVPVIQSKEYAIKY